MPRYLHIPHTPDTARTLTLSGRNCLVVSGIVTPLKSTTGAEKGAEAKCVHKARRSPTAGLLRALSRICASMRPTSRSLHALPACGNALDVPHIALHAHGKALDVPHIALPARGKAPRCTPHRAPCTWESLRCTPHRRPCTWESPAMYPTENDILTQTFNK